MSRNFNSIVFLLCFAIAQQASALFELNVGYHGLATSSSGGNWTVPGATMSGAFGLQADLRLDIPLTGIGVGVRYGKLDLNLASGANSLSLKSTSTSALLAYRLINTGILLGTVFTYGLSNSGSLTHSLASPTTEKTAGSMSTYTAGIELGIKFPILLVAEVGYGSLQMSGFGSTLSGSATNVDLAGTYVRASTGFSF